MLVRLGRAVAGRRGDVGSEPCSDCETKDTSWQRPFMVVAVRDKDPGADVAQALAAAMSDKANLPSLSAYSTFGLARFR